ncbi:MAG: hypothetical protein R3F55_17565 [Alphaproteobacteria bacterium]
MALPKQPNDPGPPASGRGRRAPAFARSGLAGRFQPPHEALHRAGLRPLAGPGARQAIPAAANDNAPSMRWRLTQWVTAAGLVVASAALVWLAGD